VLNGTFELDPPMLSRALLLLLLLIPITSCGNTLCDELDDEYEVNGCITSEDSGSASQDLDCGEGTELARVAACALDNIVDVCSPTPSEKDAYNACLTAQ
jgi:hypothetical protein